MGTTLMSNEEKQYMWNLAFHLKSLIVELPSKHSTHTLFITFNGFSWDPDSLGDKSVWIFANGRWVRHGGVSMKPRGPTPRLVARGWVWGSFSLGPDTNRTAGIVLKLYIYFLPNKDVI